MVTLCNASYNSSFGILWIFSVDKTVSVNLSSQHANLSMSWDRCFSTSSHIAQLSDVIAVFFTYSPSSPEKVICSQDNKSIMPFIPFALPEKTKMINKSAQLCVSCVHNNLIQRWVFGGLIVQRTKNVPKLCAIK